MLADSYAILEDQYKKILNKYLQEKDEQGLYHAQQFSKKVMENQISPEEMVSLHLEIIEDLFPNFLLEQEIHLNFF